MTGKLWKTIAVWMVLCLLLTSCSSGQSQSGGAREPESTERVSTEGYLKFVDENPDTVDPQCTSEYYTVALNVFDRLVEVHVDEESGESEIVPSLAESWDISPNGRRYAFHLRDNVTFSNGSPLTSSDVGFTLTRLLTHPDSCNQDLVNVIQGAQALMDGSTDTLTGFQAYGTHDFIITLERPYSPFLACLSTPGASILDEESVTEAGNRFGKEPEFTIGTGSFIFQEWTPGIRMLLTANKDCWAGPPRCEGLYIQIISDSEAQRLLFENGSLDILDLDNMGTEAEFFVHGDIYQNKLYSGPRVGITYIALNASIPPLQDVRVRRALQLSLDRQLLLNAVYGGRGQLENGIFPHGLIGYNASLPEIPYDKEEALRLLEEAGYADGFGLSISCPSTSTATMKELLTLISSMWQAIGIRTMILELPEEDFMSQRKNGEIACYSSTWSADFNDPDNFIYTFFGSEENTVSRSLCYADAEVIARVNQARSMLNETERLQEYQALERKIVQEDAAWIPLFSKQHIFVVSDRVDGFKVSWNGWSSNNYRDVALIK